MLNLRDQARDPYEPLALYTKIVEGRQNSLLDGLINLRCSVLL